MHKVGAVLSGGYYNPSSSPVFECRSAKRAELPPAKDRDRKLPPDCKAARRAELERERKKVIIHLDHEELRVAFGGNPIKSNQPKGHEVNTSNEAWRSPRKEIKTHSRPNSATSNSRPRPHRPPSRNANMDNSEVSVHVASPHAASSNRKMAAGQTSISAGSSGAPVAIRLSPSPQRSPVLNSNSRASSGRRAAECEREPGMHVDVAEGVNIRLNSPSQSPSRKQDRVPSSRPFSPTPNYNSTHFHLDNNPAQSVTVRTMKNVNVRTEALKDGVQFQLDGRPGVQLSVKMGQPGKGGLRNSIKIEAEAPPGHYDLPRSAGKWGDSWGEKWGDLLSYQRPTVSHLIHARMTQLYKELRKRLN